MNALRVTVSSPIESDTHQNGRQGFDEPKSGTPTQTIGLSSKAKDQENGVSTDPQTRGGGTSHLSAGN